MIGIRKGLRWRSVVPVLGIYQTGCPAKMVGVADVEEFHRVSCVWVLGWLDDIWLS